MSANHGLDLTVEHVPVDRLHADAVNPRRIEASQIAALEASISRFGLVQPILARRVDGTIVAGHQRLRAAVAGGRRTVPVIWLDLGGDEARALGLALNRISGDWDKSLLAQLLADLDAKSIDLAPTGFGDDELDRLLASLRARERGARTEAFDLDAVLAAAERTGRTNVGDLWSLGEHRLAVGDCTDPEVIDRVVAGHRPAMTFADPPYGVRLGHHGGQGRRSRRRTMANDNLQPEAWKAFVEAWARTIVERTDGTIYVCMSSKELPLVSQALADAGGHWSDTIIWVKDRFVIGRADYQRRYEPVWYGWREGAGHHWCGDRDQSDVWEFDRPTDSPAHPTAKPLGLVERAINNGSRPGDLILDPFGGSGTTLIAAERTGRRSAMVEVDPIYADVIVVRWEQFTGEAAVRLDVVDAPPERIP